MQTFETLIQKNKRNSVWLISAMVLFIALLCGVFAIVYSGSNPEHLLAPFVTGASYGLLLASAASVLSFYGGHRIVGAINGAIEIEYFEDPMLFNVVEEMAIAAGTPKPRVFVIFDDAPNAFATGRDPEHAVIGITTGLRKKLNRYELQAVIAHEMAHITRYDTLLMMLVAVFAGVIVLISDFFRRSFLHGLKFNGGRKKTNIVKAKRGANPYFVIAAIFVALCLAWLAPIIAKIIQLAISREREYLADATAIQYCRNPDALVSALKKISLDKEEFQYVNRATEHMFIINPDPKLKLEAFNKDSIWSTHPPLINRISRINSLRGQYVANAINERTLSEGQEAKEAGRGVAELEMHPD